MTNRLFLQVDDRQVFEYQINYKTGLIIADMKVANRLMVERFL